MWLEILSWWLVSGIFRNITKWLFHLCCPESEIEVSQSCPTLCNPMDCSLPAFSVHGILQARIPEWVTISFSRGSSRLGLLYFGQTLYPLSQDTLNRDSSDNETQGLGGEGVLANFFLFERTDLSSCPVASSNLRIVEEEEDLSCFSRIGGVWAPVFGKPPVWWQRHSQSWGAL